MTSRSQCLFVVWVLAVFFSITGSRADVIEFKNGDRLTGTILSAEVGKLKIRSALAGEIQVGLADIKTFSTDDPITLKLNDGTILKQPIAAGKEGMVGVKPGAVPNDTLPIASITSINPSSVWSGSVTAGAIVTRGDSKTEAFNLAFEANRRTDQDRFNINGQYLFGRERDNDTGESRTSTDNWRVNTKYDYFFAPKFYAFGSIGVEQDRIAELDLRLTPALGVGYQWVERPDLNLSTETGVAYVHEDYSTGGTNDNLSIKLAYHVDTTIRSGLKVFHNLTYFPSVENIGDYLIQTDAGIRADLTERFFTEFKVEWKYDSTPAPDSSRSNLRYIAGVGWRF